MLGNFMQDLPTKARQGQLLEASRWLIRTLGTAPYRHIEYTVFARSLDEPLPNAHPRIPTTMRLASESDLRRLRSIVLPSEYRHFARRLAHGRLCFLAIAEEKPEDLAAYCWATTEIDPKIDALVLDLPPASAYLDDAFTVPAYRRKGIQTAAHIFRLQHVKTLGCRRAFLIVDVKNQASQSLVRELGYQEVDRLSFRRILWKRTYHYRQGTFQVADSSLGR